MSAAVDAHVAGLDLAEAVLMPLSCISNVPTSPRSAKKQRLITECRSPTTPAQPRALAFGADCGAAAPGQPIVEEDPLAEPLASARELLRDPSATDGAPLGREAQHERVAAAAAAFAAGGRGEALYVSGLPGTGKSHTVSRALRALDAVDGGATSTLWINCMGIANAGEAYGRIHAAALAAAGGGARTSTPGKRKAPGGGNCGGASSSSSGSGSLSVSYEQLLQALRGGGGGSGGVDGSKRRRSGGGVRRVGVGAGCGGPAVAVVLDEVDALVGKGQQGVYDLFMLPHQPGVRALVIGIANSIDLTERALPALKLRGCTPALVAFPAYTAAQAAAILKACLAQLPERLIDSTALELCARQVASTSGDLRLAVKACRAALDALALARAGHFAAAAAAAGESSPGGQQQQQQQQEQQGQQQQAAAGGKAPQACVGVRDMMAALGRLAGVRSSQHGAATVANIRALPNQQQLLLYSLTILCPPPDAEAGGSAGAGGGAAPAPGAGPQSAGKGRSASSLWADLTPGRGGGGAPHSAAKPVRAPAAAAGTGRRLFSAGGKAGGGGSGGGSRSCVLAVSLDDAYGQYCRVCRLVGMGAATRADLQHMADLLAQMALVDVVNAAGPAAAAAPPAAGGGTPGTGGRRRKGPRGFGDAGGTPAAAGGGGGGGGARLSLRAGHNEVHRALAANPALRCLVDGA